jgi:hypothetical protein
MDYYFFLNILGQLRQIQKYTIGRLFCDNSDLQEVPRNAFISPSKGNPMIKCEDIASINFNYWADTDDLDNN